MHTSVFGKRMGQQSSSWAYLFYADSFHGELLRRQDLPEEAIDDKVF